jgi:hypothetical protein
MDSTCAQRPEDRLMIFETSTLPSCSGLISKSLCESELHSNFCWYPKRTGYCQSFISRRTQHKRGCRPFLQYLLRISLNQATPQPWYSDSMHVSAIASCLYESAPFESLMLLRQYLVSYLSGYPVRPQACHGIHQTNHNPLRHYF